MSFLKFIIDTYKTYQKKIKLEQEKHLISNNAEYILFSGTSNDNDFIRHFADLQAVLISLVHNKVKKENIRIVIDAEAFEELKSYSKYSLWVSLIENYVGHITEASTFTQEYKRPLNKDIFFIASGHGNINGLSVGKNNSFITSDFFEDIASEENSTILILSQCYAGAFHHLDTRKNICVLGASEYQTSLSISIDKLIKCLPTDLQNTYRSFFNIERELVINPFLLYFASILFDPNTFIKIKNKNLLNIYKKTTVMTLEVLNEIPQILDILDILDKDSSGQKQEELGIVIKGLLFVQHPFLLNKILATRYFIK